MMIDANIVVAIVNKHCLQYPDLNLNADHFLKGDVPYPQQKSKFLMMDMEHSEQKKGEHFFGNISKEQFKILKKHFPTLRLGKEPSLRHRSNGKHVAGLHPAFIKILGTGKA